MIPIEQKVPSGIGYFFLFLNATDELEKKQEIRGIDWKKSRGRSGRTREKVGNQGHRLKEKPGKERTNRRKSQKSWASISKAEESRTKTHYLTESSKSPASIARSNKQWAGTCLYQEECKLLLINCGAVIRLWANSEADCEYPLDYKNVILIHQNPYNYVMRL